MRSSKSPLENYIEVLGKCRWPYKLRCLVRMVLDSILPHAVSGPNDHRKDAPPFIIWPNEWMLFDYFKDLMDVEMYLEKMYHFAGEYFGLLFYFSALFIPSMLFLRTQNVLQRLIDNSQKWRFLDLRFWHLRSLTTQIV